MLSLRIAFLSLVLGSAVPGQLSIAPVFGDHMVLQMEKELLLWGKARPGEELEIRLAGASVVSRVAADGRWQASLPAMTAGGPHSLEVRSGDESLLLEDILIGEVWLCSGQSNMEWPLKQTDGGEDFIAGAGDAQLRVLEVRRRASAGPNETIDGQWQVCSSDSVAEFSAVAYHFGVELRSTLGVPVGLIQSAWGGTPAEAWTSRDALSADPRLLDRVISDAALSARHSMAKARASFDGVDAPREPRAASRPAYLYNGMIAPLLPLNIRGVIWYQGESNAGRAEEYRYLFPAMIRNWRRDFGQGDFPFLFVQLANWENGRGWPELREAQTLSLAEPKTAMAVSIDIGDAKDIHPGNKQDVGLRLALAARALAYGEDLVHSGPTLDSWESEGASLRLSFQNADGGYRVLGESIEGFEIAGEDGEYQVAEARIDGETIVVSNAEIAEPKRVRYGWHANPSCNVYNRHGLPMVPFRSHGPLMDGRGR